MRSRTRSIRFKILALSLAPLPALLALWGYSAGVTVGDAVGQRHWQTLNRNVAGPTQDLLRELARERVLSVTFLGRHEATDRQALDMQRGRTDPVLAWFRGEVLAPESQDAYPATAERYAAETIHQLGLLTGVRGAVDSGAADRVTALESYNGMIESLFRLFGGFSTRNDVGVYQGTQAIALAHRGLDMIGRESALIAGAGGAGGRLTVAERDMFMDYAHVRRFLMDEARAQLAGTGFRDTYEQVFASPAYQGLSRLEEQIVTGSRSDDRLPEGTGGWQPTADALSASLDGAAVRSREELNRRSERLAGQALVRLGLVGGLGLLLVVFSVVLSIRFGDRVGRELVELRSAARRLAEERLPRVVGGLRDGAEVDVTAEAPPLEAGRIAEIVDVAESLSMVQRTAIEAAVGQAEVQKGVNQIFLSLARRNQSLLHRQITMLDMLESRAEPDLLEDLFRLDHLTTRMRRHAEGLIILSGAAPGRGWRDPVRIVDVLRGAVAEVEDYTRVAVLTTSQDAVVGSAVADVIHLFAELMENATSFSPPSTEVHVMAQMVGNGLVVEIEDRGLGMTAAALDELNRRLAEPPDFDLADTDRLGLFVVGRLAERHDVSVSLRRSPYGGTTAIVLLPHTIVVSRHDLPPGPDEPETPPSPVAGTEPATDTAETPVLRSAVRLRQSRLPAGPVPGPVGRHRARPQEQRTPESHPPEQRPEPVPASDPAPAGTYGELPRRVRQQNLVPQLRTDSPDRPADEEPGVARSPEQAGALISSMQAGWRRGRAAAESAVESAAQPAAEGAASAEPADGGSS